MLTNATSATLVSGKLSQPIVSLMFLILLAFPLVSCSDNGSGTGPLVSSLPTPTDATDSENTSGDAAEAPDLGAEEPMDDPLPLRPLLPEDAAQANSSADLPAEPDSPAPEEDSIASLVDAPQDKPAISLASTPTGATASLTWQPVSDPKVQGYYIYYGKQPSEESGVCSYEERIAADTPPVTIEDLEPNTPYFFAVSSYGRLESPCSNEVTAITPPAGT